MITCSHLTHRYICNLQESYRICSCYSPFKAPCQPGALAALGARADLSTGCFSVNGWPRARGLLRPVILTAARKLPPPEARGPTAFPSTTPQVGDVPEYRAIQSELARGWNTWDSRDVLRYVLLPEGLTVDLALKRHAWLEEGYLDDALIGRRGEDVERIRPRRPRVGRFVHAARHRVAGTFGHGRSGPRGG